MSTTTMPLSEEIQPGNNIGLEQRIKDLNRVLQEVEHMKHELAADIERLTTLKETVDARTFESLIRSQDYSADDVYRPAPEDEKRLVSFNQRKAVGNRVSEARKKIISLVGTERRIGEKILSLEKALIPSPKTSIRELMNEVLYSRLIDSILGTRSRIQRQIANLHSDKECTVTELQNVRRVLTEAENDLAGMTPMQTYDQQLHMFPRKVLLERRSQSILFSYAARKKTVTLIIPATPTENDFTVQVAIDLNAQEDIDDFQRFLGYDLAANNADYNLIEENISYNGDVETQLIPFSLEVVEVEGIDRLRLPQAFYDRFSPAML